MVVHALSSPTVSTVSILYASLKWRRVDPKRVPTSEARHQRSFNGPMSGIILVASKGSKQEQKRRHIVRSQIATELF
jgi:hypothetical protein